MNRFGELLKGHMEERGIARPEGLVAMLDGNATRRLAAAHVEAEMKSTDPDRPADLLMVADLGEVLGLSGEQTETLMLAYVGDASREERRVS